MTASNNDLADLLDRIAHALDTKEANRYRVGAYERAARALREADESIAALYAGSGEAGIRSISGIGEGISHVLSEYLETGRSRLLNDLLAELQPRSLVKEVPGIGDELAHRIVSELGVSTLEELEEAAHDGRLNEVAGMGHDRVQAVRDHLARRLGGGGATSRRSGTPPSGGTSSGKPSEEVLLDVDREYREKAGAGKLRTIAPRRFNPDGRAWLPILETQREGWQFTALYSNTARAHEEGKTRDWVVIYWERDGRKGQNTVVSAQHGPHAGERIVAH